MRKQKKKSRHSKQTHNRQYKDRLWRIVEQLFISDWDSRKVTDNKKSFRVGEDIAFTLFNKVTNHHDHYIGNIIEMTDTSIKISNIEIDRCHEDGEMIIDLENIESNSCNYVYYD